MMASNWKYVKKTTFVLLLTCLGFSEASSAQYMEFEYSDEFRYTNRKTGFFTEFIGANQSSIYLLHRNISKSKPYDDAKVMIVSLNRNSLSEDTLIHLKGFSENEAQAEDLESLDYIKTVVTGGRVVVFWRKLTNTDTTRKEEIYGQSFKPNLTSNSQLRKVFEYTQIVDEQQSIFDETMCVVLTNPESDRIVLGTERFKKGQLEFYYVNLSASLEGAKARSVTLEHKPKVYPGHLTSSYAIGSTEDVYIRSTVPYTKDELWELPVGHPKSFLSFTFVNMESGEHTHVKLEGEDKTITDFEYKSLGSKTRVLGFFGDLSRDTTGVDKQGVFYVDIDHKSLAKTDLKFTFFDRSTTNRLFPKKLMRKRAKEGISDEELLGTRFDIEHIEVMPDSSLVLFFTSEYNRTETNTRSDLKGQNVYETETFYEKSDVSALRFSKEGEVMWARSLERKITYEGKDLDDIRIVFKYNDFIVLYGNEDVKMKPPNRRKKFKHLTEELEYATFDSNSGRAKTYTTEVNEPKTDQRDKHFVNPNTAVVINDQFYFCKMRIHQNPFWTAANVVFFPTLYYTILTGNTKVATAEFAMMRVMEGKRPRKRR